MAKRKSTGTDALAALTAAAGKKPTTAAKKSTIQSTTLDAGDAEAVMNWHNGHRLKKTGESLMASAEETLIDIGLDDLAERSLKSGSVVKSVRLAGECEYVQVDSDGSPVLQNGKPVQKHFQGSVRCTQAAKFLKMTDAAKTALEAEFTDPVEYKRLFATDQKFEIDVSAINERKGLANRLLNALGEDADILTIVTSVKPTEAFLTEAMTNPKMTKRWKTLQENGLCKLQKPSFAK
jgi:hypothetical protein